MCVGFKRPPARLSVCQLGLWGGLSSTSPTLRAPKRIGVPITASSATQRKKHVYHAYSIFASSDLYSRLYIHVFLLLLISWREERKKRWEVVRGIWTCVLSLHNRVKKLFSGAETNNYFQIFWSSMIQFKSSFKKKLETFSASFTNFKIFFFSLFNVTLNWVSVGFRTFCLTKQHIGHSQNLVLVKRHLWHFIEETTGSVKKWIVRFIKIMQSLVWNCENRSLKVPIAFKLIVFLKQNSPELQSPTKISVGRYWPTTDISVLAYMLSDKYFSFLDYKAEEDAWVTRVMLWHWNSKTHWGFDNCYFWKHLFRHNVLLKNDIGKASRWDWCIFVIGKYHLIKGQALLWTSQHIFW